MLIKTWFSLIVVILLGALSFALYYFDLTNILDWTILVVLLSALILTVLVYLEQPHKNDLKKLQKTYADFLKQKDAKIEELNKKSDVIFKTAMRHTDETLRIEQLKKKLEEKKE